MRQQVILLVSRESPVVDQELTINENMAHVGARRRVCQTGVGVVRRLQAQMAVTNNGYIGPLADFEAAGPPLEA
jgi:hypothetical protein